MTDTLSQCSSKNVLYAPHLLFSRFARTFLPFAVDRRRRRRSQMSPPPPSAASSSSSAASSGTSNRCTICHDPETDVDAIVRCEVCRLKLHPRCYYLGLPEMPLQWRCDICTDGKDTKSQACILCNKRRSFPMKRCVGQLPGAAKQSSSPSYAHVDCGKKADGIAWKCLYKRSEADQNHTFDITEARPIRQSTNNKNSLKNDAASKSAAAAAALKADMLAAINKAAHHTTASRKKKEKPKRISNEPPVTSRRSSVGSSSGANKKQLRKLKVVSDGSSSNNSSSSSDSETLLNSSQRLSSVKRRKLGNSKKQQQPNSCSSGGRKSWRQDFGTEVERYKRELEQFHNLLYTIRNAALKDKSPSDILVNDDYDDDLKSNEYCQVCGLGYIPENSPTDLQIIICGNEPEEGSTIPKRGCDLTVHNYCHCGPFDVPDDDWYCDPCANGLNQSEMICAICEQHGRPNGVGGFKRLRISSSKSRSTTTARKLKSEWAHLVCAQHVKHCWVDSTDSYAPIRGVEVIEETDRRICSICHNRGATVRCANQQCLTAFHPSCAMYQRYQFENITPQEAEAYTSGDNRVVFCPIHNANDFD